MRIAVIPARGGSKRIPRKNIIDFHGKSMITRTIENLQAADAFDLIHVSTDDDEIAQIARTEGADVRFMRPSSLSDDNAPILPVIKWVLEKFREEGSTFSTAMLAMPCAPLLEAIDYRSACEAFDKTTKKLPMLSVCRFPSPPEWAFTETQTGTVKADPLMLLKRAQDLPRTYFDCGLFSIFSSDFLLESNLQVATEFKKFEISRMKALDIDNQDDLEFARLMFRARGMN